MSEILNANPTIRNPSDLPTRRRRTPSQTKDQNPLGLFVKVVPSSIYYSLDPFEPSASLLDDSDDDASIEPIDEQEIYDLISSISDPEHPLSLGSLGVVNLPDIKIQSLSSTSPITLLTVLITPTITHCSLATVIGLGVRVRLERALPPRFRVKVEIKEGSHSTAREITKQLGDKERVAAALENDTLMGVLRKMWETCR